MNTDTDSARTPYEHPWKQAPDGLAANLALADLINNLPRKLTFDGRLHAETLLAVSGAIAGYAAQRALMSGMTPEQVLHPSSGFDIVRAPHGGLFFIGAPLNQALIPLTPADRHKLWPLAASGAITAGLDPADLPEVGPMFEYGAKTLGSDQEGTPSIGGVQFQAPVPELLKAAWPLALMCFNSQLSGAVLKPAVAVSQRWWPVIAAIAANQMIRDTASVIPPRTALIIVMETAIYATKLAPVAIEPQPSWVSA